jgi:AraC-like DNA-binding protein
MDPQFETVELEGDSCFRTLHFHCDSLQKNHNWHYHPECELTYVLQGEGTRFVGDSVDHFKAGDLVMVGPNIPHCWTNDDVNNKASPKNELVVLQFMPTCLGEDFLNSPDAQALRDVFERAKRGLVISSEQSLVIGDKMLQLDQAKGLARLGGFIDIMDQISQLNEYQLLTSELYIADNSEFHSGRMKKVMDYIQTHLMDDIRQTEIAEQVSMTPQGFSRFFRSTTGRTFVSFVNIMRIMEACRLLVNSDNDITDIAFGCGYGNLSNFNRRFAELKHCTPSEYRKNHQQLFNHQ